MGGNILILSVGPVPSSNNSIVEGGGLRAWGLAQGLIKNNVSVTVAIPENFNTIDEIHESGVKICKWSFNNLERLLKQYGAVYVLYSRGDLMKFVAEKLDPKKQLIVDLYVPIYIESLAQELKGTQEEFDQYLFNLSHWNTAFPRGDFFLCANETQYHFYNGVLSALGRINPLTFGKNLLDIVPYGIYNKPLAHDKVVCKGKIIEKSDFMVLWFGGLYPWFDIKPLLDSIKKLSLMHPDIKLIILGGKNPFVVDQKFMKQYEIAMNFAKNEELLNNNIFFIDWIPYEERNNWYIESDLVINLHHKTKETIYSWRTRIVDFIWGEIPLLSTGGDEATEYLAKKDCARLLENNTALEIIKNIEELYQNKTSLDQMKENIKNIKSEFYWESVTKNLSSFLQSSKISADREMLLNKIFNQSLQANPPARKSIPYLLKMTIVIFFKRGPLDVLKKIRNFMKLH
jgi:glycosyltransferase involved in cell wall biosynthesis